MMHQDSLEPAAIRFTPERVAVLIARIHIPYGLMRLVLMRFE